MWTIGSSLVAGTNGATYLKISHSGSTGSAQIDVAGFASGYKATIIDSTVSSTAGIALGGGTSYPFSVVADAGGGEPFNMVGLWYGTNIAGALQIGTYSKTISLGTTANNNWGGVRIGALALYAATTCPVVSIYAGASLTVGLAGTSGTQVGLSVGTVDGAVPLQNADPAGGSIVFSPTSGNAKFYALNVNPIINQTGTASGSYTALLINATETAVLGTANMLIDCQVSNVRVWGITNKGHEIVGSANNDGSGVISSVSGTTVSKTYAIAYTSTPIVTVTPTTNAGAYYLSASSNTGFTVTYASSGAQTFNYQVIGNPN